MLLQPEFKIDLPLYVGGKSRILKSGVKTPPTKKYWLTLNNYRNWHYQTANNTKVLFKAEIQDQILQLPDLTALWGQIHLTYVMFPPNKAQRDLLNNVSIVGKYFEDALVELGKLQDDNNKIIPEYSCKMATIDKINPRMEVFIRPFLRS